jgi:hypothetical protein
MDKQNMPSRGRALLREVEEQLQGSDSVIAGAGRGCRLRGLPGAARRRL